MSNQCHYMQKDDGPVVKVNLNDWARKRKDGFKFSTKKEYEDQVQNAAPDRDEDQTFPTMENTKAEILEYAAANGFDLDEGLNKTDLLEMLEA